MRTARVLHVRRLAMALVCLCAALAACQTAAPTPTAQPSATPTPAATATATATPSPVPPNLEGGGALARRCDQYQMFAARPMVPGQLAVDFTLKDTKGKAYTLSRLLAEKPVIVILGSYTSPQFRQQCAANEELYKTWGALVHVITIYTKEAHPIEQNPAQFSRDARGTPMTQPQTYAERLAMAARTVKEAGITMPVLVDEMDNPLWCTYGRMPNNAFLIGQDGYIVARQDWNDARRLQQTIREYLGIW
jgi:hypothetical protein